LVIVFLILLLAGSFGNPSSVYAGSAAFSHLLSAVTPGPRPLAFKDRLMDFELG